MQDGGRTIQNGGRMIQNGGEMIQNGGGKWWERLMQNGGTQTNEF